jgi:hypothetical protein
MTYQLGYLLQVGPGHSMLRMVLFVQFGTTLRRSGSTGKSEWR